MVSPYTSLQSHTSPFILSKHIAISPNAFLSSYSLKIKLPIASSIARPSHRTYQIKSASALQPHICPITLLFTLHAFSIIYRSNHFPNRLSDLINHLHKCLFDLITRISTNLFQIKSPTWLHLLLHFCQVTHPKSSHQSHIQSHIPQLAHIRSNRQSIFNLTFVQSLF